MLTLDRAGNTIGINVASRVINILLRRQLLQNHLILKLPVMKGKSF